MAAPARFLFDNDFSAPANRADAVPAVVMIPEPEHLAAIGTRARGIVEAGYRLPGAGDGTPPSAA